MSWQRFKLNVPKKLSPVQRTALAQEVIDFIINRSKNGLDKNNKPFPGYSENYIKSLDFKIAGKSKSKVNLTLSEEMLQSLSLISTKPGEILIGYDKSNKDLNAKVEGNVLGTYGQKTPIKGKSRDFLGIKKDDLKDLVDKVSNKEEAKDLLNKRASLGDLADGIEFEETD